VLALTTAVLMPVSSAANQTMALKKEQNGELAEAIDFEWSAILESQRRLSRPCVLIYARLGGDCDAVDLCHICVMYGSSRFVAHAARLSVTDCPSLLIRVRVLGGQPC
jgi:hypothetical protein